jgi:tryptophan 2,3-dioxygenase
MSSNRPVTEYERYLRIPELLTLQKPVEARAHHDELLFQVVHQVEELWMKLALDELLEATRLLDADALIEARYSLSRVHQVVALMTTQFRLIEQMLPHSYFAVRAALGHGSGQESPGFNGMLHDVPKLWAPFTRALERHDVTLLSLHKDPGKHPALLAIGEALIDIDEGFQTFRYHHLCLVKRILGHGTPSLKGKPTDLLQRSMSTQLFPELWAVREDVFRHFVPGPPIA